ncbi:MAG: YczE/YyaS/YitT family protein [Actinomycetota bacterium]
MAAGGQTQRGALGRRLVALFAGLLLFGASIALLVRSGLGLDSWDVFHQGLAERTGMGLGTIVIGVGAVVLALWIPLRQRPGIGTVANVIVVGPAVDLSLAALATPENVVVRVAFMVAGIMTNAIATGLYIGAGLGPGPRDGLMTGLVSRGLSLRFVRTSIELAVLGAGWVLGGTVGIGTLAYALSIGPLVHYLLPRLTIADDRPLEARVDLREEEMAHD